MSPDHSPIYVGVLVTLLYFALMGAVLFVPIAADVDASMKGQIVTASTGGWLIFMNWIFGSSKGSREKDQAIAARGPLPALPSPPKEEKSADA